MSAALLSELARIKVLFQLHAIGTVLGFPTHTLHHTPDGLPQGDAAAGGGVPFFHDLTISGEAQ